MEGAVAGKAVTVEEAVVLLLGSSLGSLLALDPSLFLLVCSEPLFPLPLSSGVTPGHFSVIGPLRFGSVVGVMDGSGTTKPLLIADLLEHGEDTVSTFLSSQVLVLVKKAQAENTQDEASPFGSRLDRVLWLRKRSVASSITSFSSKNRPENLLSPWPVPRCAQSPRTSPRGSCRHQGRSC